jgi:hypothetical protein
MCHYLLLGLESAFGGEEERRQVSERTDSSRQHHLADLYERHNGYMEWLHANEIAGPLAAIITHAGASAATIGTVIDLYNPREVEHFLLGAAWMATAIFEGSLVGLHDLLGEQGHTAMSNGISTDLSTLCEALAQYLPQIGREH